MKSISITIIVNHSQETDLWIISYSLFWKDKSDLIKCINVPKLNILSPTNFRIMNNKNAVIVSIALAILFIGTMAIMTINSVYANSKNKGTSTQQSSCGNEVLSSNIFCQNVGSNAHGRGNAAVVNATQP